MKIKRRIGMGVLVLGFEGLICMGTMPPAFADWRTVTVQPNQTLWSLGTEYGPKADTQDVVSAIEARNHVGDTIQPGEVLQIPTRSVPLWQRLGL